MSHAPSTRPDASSPPAAPAGDAPPFRYGAALADEIETRWQASWESTDAFRTPNPGDPGFAPDRPKFFCMDMFPYPSGAGLHVGHPLGYIATDIVCRYKRHRGFNVLHPMGWDAFGLPAEQYAIQTGIHPAITTRTAIDNFRRQLKRFGFSYDWSREFATIDEDYYRWTQWIWLQAYQAWFDPEQNRGRPIAELTEQLEAGTLRVNEELEVVRDGSGRAWSDLDAPMQRRVVDSHRLAYLDEQTVNWCPALGTVLANEEVIDGRSERGGHPVLRKPLKQWMFRITAYADRLIGDLGCLDWPESTRTMQKEWIGRSEGADVDFAVPDTPDVDWPQLRVYTTRPDTLFGATFMVIAPEHPLVASMIAHPRAETDVTAIEAYVEASRHRADVDRMADSKDKTGVATGFDAVNPATGARIPIWIADYVLWGYGHGAIMAVPANDDRDFAFATKFGLPIVDVVDRPLHTLLREATRRLDAASGAAERVAPDQVAATVAAFVEAGLKHPDGDRDAQWTDALEAPSAEAVERAAEAWPGALGAELARAPETVLEAARRYTLVTVAGEAEVESGAAVNSANDECTLNGLATADAKQAIITWLEQRGHGRHKVNFRLRDWLFSRQRYWGEPFPIVFDADGNHYPVSESSLPVVLPELEDYQPVVSDDPQPLLAKATDWVETTAGAAGVSADLLPPDTPVRRETNTMPGWAGSCWYYLRYCDPQSADRFVSRECERYWMLSGKCPIEDPDKYGTFVPEIHHLGSVDLYVGGAEHAVLHLLYARFWHKILFDLGEVSTPEPFGKLFHQGMITSYAYQRADKSLVAVDEVSEAPGGGHVETATGDAVTQVIAKMSKSLRNVINPDDVIREYGADTFRLYEMYMGPLEASKPWNTRDIVGVHRFLQRVWRLVVDEETGTLSLRESADDATERLLHRTIQKTGDDIERLSFNTAIAALIEFINEATKSGGLTTSQLARFAIILSPFAPHMAEELHARAGEHLGLTHSVATEPWPDYDPAMLREDTLEMPVQVKGKVRSRITVPAGASNEVVEQAALADDRIRELLAGQTIRKVIIVPGKIVNLIV